MVSSCSSGDDGSVSDGAGGSWKVDPEGVQGWDGARMMQGWVVTWMGSFAPRGPVCLWCVPVCTGGASTQ